MNAVFSADGRYRYTLRRDMAHDLFAPARPCHAVNFVMLNPSTATETSDDPTVRRCTAYARRWGYSSLVVTNLFAYRATDPSVLKFVTDPVGPDNDRHISEVAARAVLVVVAWGNHGGYLGRDEAVLRLLAGAGKVPHCLAVTRAGRPGHPLYLRAYAVPVPYLHREVPCIP